MFIAYFTAAVRPALFAFAFALASLTAAGSAWAFNPQKFAAIAVDAATGEVLYAHKADVRRFPASLTKVMTIYLAYDAIAKGELKLSDKVVMSPRAASRPPSKLGLAAGRSLTVREALDVLVVKSANDVATALAERIAGTESAFAARMTARAKALGMSHTRFRNASGLPDPRQVTSARDMAILAMAFLSRHPEAYRIFDQERTTFRGRRIRGHNRLLAKEGIDGFKTGYTRASGFNLLTSGIRDGRRIIAVVLGGRTAASRDRFMSQLITASFSALAIRHAGNDVEVATLLGPDTPASPRSGVQYVRLEDSRDAQAAPHAQGSGKAPRWSVQVGAYSSAARGRARIADLSRKYPRRFEAAGAHLDRIGSAHQVRFDVGSHTAAAEACRVLKSNGDECLVLHANRGA